VRWTGDGIRQPTCIFEAAAWHYAVKPVCACGHSSTFAPHGLWWHFERHGWDDSFAATRRYFWCRVCGIATRKKRHPARIETTSVSALDIALPLPDKRIWKRAVSRFRA
jgi:hypothetical protein